jgi:fructokinase
MDKKYVCCFGEILWDVLPTGKQPGGAPMNVGLHLKNLNIDVALISRVGNDDFGQELKSFVNNKKCSTEWIQTDSKFSTGKVLANVSDKSEVKYEILQPVAWDFIEATPDTIKIAKNASVFVFGSLACRQEISRKTLLSLLQETNALKIFDVNFRSPHYNKELVEALLHKADVVKMNKDELLEISSWYSGNGSITDHAEYLKNKFALQKIIITLGAEGALLVDNSGVHKSKVYKVKIKDTIGSGDSFLAGIIKNLLSDKPTEDMINYACALGALVAQHEGANPSIKEEQIFELMQQ